MHKLIQDTEYFKMLPIDGEGRYYPASPDGWPVGGHRLEVAESWEESYFGAGVIRFQTGIPVIPTLPIRIRVTGRKLHETGSGNYRIRVQFEHIKDGEPSEYQGGWLYLWDNLD